MVAFGEDQEAMPMGDILCDILGSHEFSHWNLAANSPGQDLFGILDFIEIGNHREEFKFISLEEEESSICNQNGDNFTVVSHLQELSVLEQEPKQKPESDHNILNFAFLANACGHCCPDTNVPRSTEPESCQKSKNCELRSDIDPSDFFESETDQAFDNPKQKRLNAMTTTTSDQVEVDGQQRTTHVAVEGNRRKQMNERLAVLRSLMPRVYVQRVMSIP